MALFLEKLAIKSDDDQYINYFLLGPKKSKSNMTCFTSTFPFRSLSHLESSPKNPIIFEFAPITVLSGDNGSGKSTILNVLAKKLKLARKAPHNETFFFEDFCNDFCSIRFRKKPLHSGIITSDDIFDLMLDRRTPWNSIQSLKESDQKFQNDNNESEDWEDSAEIFFPEKIDLVSLKSNGQTALQYIRDSIRPNGLYLMDEPENSLSFKYERILFEVIREATERQNCQFIISTHSPVLLGLPNAKIFNFDSKPMRVLKWEEVPSVKVYLDFFSSNGFLDEE